jgi:hypothetical protein
MICKARRDANVSAPFGPFGFKKIAPFDTTYVTKEPSLCYTSPFLLNFDVIIIRIKIFKPRNCSSAQSYSIFVNKQNK